MITASHKSTRVTEERVGRGGEDSQGSPYPILSRSSWEKSKTTKTKDERFGNRTKNHCT